MSKVTVKYQVTIPPRIRAALNIMPGIEVDFQEEKGRFFLVKNPGINPIEKWRGALKTKRSTDEFITELRGYGVESIDGVNISKGVGSFVLPVESPSL